MRFDPMMTTISNNNEYLEKGNSIYTQYKSKQVRDAIKTFFKCLHDVPNDNNTIECNRAYIKKKKKST
jgi:hypothetical protein